MSTCFLFPLFIQFLKIQTWRLYLYKHSYKHSYNIHILHINILFHIFSLLHYHQLVAYKDSSKVGSKTLQRRSNFVKKELSICSSNDGTKIQAAHLFERGERESILKLANILPSEVDTETMVSMKVDLSIPWEKLKNISR